MTYICPQSQTKLSVFMERLEDTNFDKAVLRKVAIAASLTVGALALFTLLAPKKDGPVPTSAPAAATADFTVKSQTVDKIPGTQAKTVNVKGKAIPGTGVYRSVDNAIRDIQMDVAVSAKPLRRAIINENNPVRVVFTKLIRLFTLPGLLIGFAFLFTLSLLGFIKPDGEDLGRY